MARNNITDSDVIRLYGGAPTDDPTTRSLGTSEPRNQGVTEVLAVGTTYRRAAFGSKKGGRIALQVFVDVAGGAASAGTVWYSNVPDPDLATDADWFADAAITIDLTVAGNKMFFISNNMARWIMVKMVPAVTPASVRAFVRVEGTSVQAP